MQEAWDDLNQVEAAFGKMPGPHRLAMAAELLEWTVANFRTPIADPVVSDLVARATATIREAVGRGASTATGQDGFTTALFEASEETEEVGAYELLVSLYLCFDDLDPEIRPDRLTTVFDQCYQADLRRYSQPAIAVGDAREITPREQAILDFQRALINRYTG
ncbi:hypothetical protein [Glycomyces harbinensis]|uniref:Uncharacterized protein n=1 Tax=Glycomyces harbinensis TaxID=58114 RepID=A0A1G6Y5J5_9ACTN|nr:hypothetical protein [Glycomyces harbinensis]SDD85630.1 hypothetical protein SAMN05216270_108146 [Glycomyces harbinensis]